MGPGSTSQPTAVPGRARGATIGVAASLVVAAALLPACPTVDLGDSPPELGQCRPDPTYFSEVIWPQYLAPSDINKSCVGRSGCHAQDTGRSALRLITTDPTSPASLQQNYNVAIRFLNCATPNASLLLAKPLAGVEVHSGGDLFTNVDDPAAQAFLGWFAP